MEIDLARFYTDLQHLQLCAAHNDEAVVEGLQRIVGRYHPNRKVNEDHSVSAARGNTAIFDKSAVAAAAAAKAARTQCRGRGTTMYRDHIKRLLDLVLSLAAAVVLAIPMAALAVWIKLDSPGPVFFRQRRVGAHKVHFNILKFRTMRGDTPHDVPTHLLKNADSYITKSGAFLRRTSLDELPQIYNIIAGQMSIIGPRPALYNQYDLIEARDAVHANDIRPGLTGLAQINGRDELPIEVKARYDGEYAADVTFRRDVSIFFHSITYVFARRGVVEGGTGALDAEKRDGQRR